MYSSWTKLKSEEKGFTLTELIIVIIILGVIASVAIPKFTGLSNEARISVARGVGANVSSSISILHSNWLVSGVGYGVDDVIANTQFSGGVSVTNLDDILTFVSGPRIYTWTYHPRNDEVAGFITEDSGSGFP